MGKWKPDVVPAPTISTPEQPAYEATFHDLTAGERRKFKSLETKRKAAKSFFDPAKRPITRLRRGALICFNVFGHLRNHKMVSSGIVLQRRGPVVQVVSTYRLVTLTLNQRHPSWQEYRQRLAIKKAERFIARQRNAAFRNFLRSIHESRKQWQSKGSDFEAKTTAETNERWPKKHKSVSELLNLLRYTYS